MNKGKMIFTLATFFVVGLFIIGFSMNSALASDSKSRSGIHYPKTEAFDSQMGIKALSLQEAYNKIAEKNMPAVVSLHVTQTIEESQRPFHFFGDDDFLERFFGLPNQRQFKRNKRKEQTYGTGFIITKDGYLISNFHVVKNASLIKVVFKDGSEYEAEIIGTDPDTDIALLKIKKGKNFPTVLLGDSKKVKIGDIAVAIGNPFGLSHTFTSGVISAKGRTGMGHKYENFIQTDVAINPGNSGGPLLDLKGRVIGINSMIYSRSGGSIGIGFAIPINMAKSIIEQLESKGKVIRGWLGVSIQDVSPQLAEDLDIKQTGVYVAEVVVNSPAQKGGLKAGDIILKYNNKFVDNSKDLVNQVGSTSPGTTVDVGVLRKNKKRIITVSIEENNSKNSKMTKATGITNEALGIVVSDSKKGVAIDRLTADSPFRGKDVQSGDVIRMVDYQEIKSTDELVKLLKKRSKAKKIIFHIQRNSYLNVVVIYPQTKKP